MHGFFQLPSSVFIAYPDILRVIERGAYCRVGYEITSPLEKSRGLRVFMGYCTLWDKADSLWEAHFREPVSGVEFAGWEWVR